MSRDSRDIEEVDRVGLLAGIDQLFQDLVAHTVLYNQMIAERLGFNLTDLQCVNVLLLHGPLTAGQLAERSGLTSGAITGLADRLERAGFIERRRGESDRRRVYLHVLPHALEVLGPAYDSIGEGAAEMYSHYSDDELRFLVRYFKDAIQLGDVEREKLRQDHEV